MGGEVGKIVKAVLKQAALAASTWEVVEPATTQPGTVAADADVEMTDADMEIRSTPARMRMGKNGPKALAQRTKLSGQAILEDGTLNDDLYQEAAQFLMTLDLVDHVPDDLTKMLLHDEAFASLHMTSEEYVAKGRTEERRQRRKQNVPVGTRESLESLSSSSVDGVKKHKLKRTKKGKAEFGRLNQGSWPPLASTPSRIRGVLMTNMVEVDIENAHPTILQHFAEKAGIPTDVLQSYVGDAKALRQELGGHYIADATNLAARKDLGKTMLLVTTYDGDFANHADRTITTLNKKFPDAAEPRDCLPPKLQDYAAEIKAMGKVLVKANPKVVAGRRKLLDGKKPRISTILSDLCCSVEVIVIARAVRFMLLNDSVPVNLDNSIRLTYAYDGVYIPKSERLTQEVLEKLRLDVEENIGINAKWGLKDPCDHLTEEQRLVLDDVLNRRGPSGDPLPAEPTSEADLRDALRRIKQDSPRQAEEWVFKSKGLPKRAAQLSSGSLLQKLLLAPLLQNACTGWVLTYNKSLSHMRSARLFRPTYEGHLQEIDRIAFRPDDSKEANEGWRKRCEGHARRVAEDIFGGVPDLCEVTFSNDPCASQHIDFGTIVSKANELMGAGKMVIVKVKAGMGSGKTFGVINKFIPSMPSDWRVAFITPLIALNNSVVNELKEAGYININRHDSTANTSKKRPLEGAVKPGSKRTKRGARSSDTPHATVPNTLEKMLGLKRRPHRVEVGTPHSFPEDVHFDCIVIDEASTVMKSFAAMKDAEKKLHALKAAVAKARVVLMTDADLDEKTVTWFDDNVFNHTEAEAERINVAHITETSATSFASIPRQIHNDSLLLRYLFVRRIPVVIPCSTGKFPMRLRGVVRNYLEGTVDLNGVRLADDAKRSHHAVLQEIAENCCISPADAEKHALEVMNGFVCYVGQDEARLDDQLKVDRKFVDEAGEVNHRRLKVEFFFDERRGLCTCSVNRHFEDLPIVPTWVFAYTPAMSVGVSFTTDRFQHAVAYFTFIVLEVQKLCQMLRRFRKVKHVDVYIQYSAASDKFTYKDTLSLEVFKGAIARLSKSQFGMTVDANRSTDDFVLELNRENIRSMFRQHGRQAAIACMKTAFELSNSFNRSYDLREQDCDDLATVQKGLDTNKRSKSMMGKDNSKSVDANKVIRSRPTMQQFNTIRSYRFYQKEHFMPPGAACTSDELLNSYNAVPPLVLKWMSAIGDNFRSDDVSKIPDTDDRNLALHTLMVQRPDSFAALRKFFWKCRRGNHREEQVSTHDMYIALATDTETRILRIIELGRLLGFKGPTDLMTFLQGSRRRQGVILPTRVIRPSEIKRMVAIANVAGVHLDKGPSLEAVVKIAFKLLQRDMNKVFRGLTVRVKDKAFKYSTQRSCPKQTTVTYAKLNDEVNSHFFPDLSESDSVHHVGPSQLPPKK